MPRLSDQALATLELVDESSIEVIRRLRAPDELTLEQRVEFQRVVSVMPADWFAAGNVAALCQYCRHVIAARRIGEMIEAAASSGDGDAVERLLKAQIQESRIIYNLMTALRLTPQSVSPPVSSVKKLRAPESPWSGYKAKQQTQARPAKKDD